MAVKQPIFTVSLCGLLLLLAACAAQPYWKNDRWVGELYRSVQAGLTYPSDADPKAQQVSATVQFTQTAGRLQDAEIMNSSGSKLVDAAIVDQLDNAIVPTPSGAQSDVPHRFQMDVHLTTPTDTYQAALQGAIRRAVHYPQGGGFGRVTVSFDYVGGKVYNVKVDHPSGSKPLDRAAMIAVVDASLPQTPDALKDFTHFVLGICFGSNNFCGQTQTVIQVTNDPGTAPAVNH